MHPSQTPLALVIDEASMCLHQGPGGGAVEGPPLLDRLSGSAHGGLEYFKARGESAHGGQVYLTNEYRSESVHGGGNHWRIMRAAAAASAWRSSEGPGWLPSLSLSLSLQSYLSMHHPSTHLSWVSPSLYPCSQARHP